MPFAQTWSEELVAEWLELKGYLVAIEIPGPTKKGKGGRTAPDIVGARIRKGRLKIVHAEVGNWPINEDQIRELVDRKFDEKVVNTVKDYFRKRLDFKGDIDYQKLLVATWLSKRREKQVIEMTKNIPELQYMHLRQIFTDKIPSALEKYKEGKPITSPSSLHLIQLIENMILSLFESTRTSRKMESIAKNRGVTVLELIRTAVIPEWIERMKEKNSVKP